MATVVIRQPATIKVSTGTVPRNALVTGSLVPDTDVAYDLGSPEHRFRSLYISGNTIDLGGALIKQDSNTGSISLVPTPSSAHPNPTGILITPQGGISAVGTINGQISANNIQSAVSNSTSYLAFKGADAGFF